MGGKPPDEVYLFWGYRNTSHVAEEKELKKMENTQLRWENVHFALHIFKTLSYEYKYVYFRVKDINVL